MNGPFDIYQPPEQAYRRNVLFALEVLDAVTLQRVTQGLTVTAAGLKGNPIVNAGGLFVWLQEDPAALQQISINAGALPYESIDIPAAQVQMPLETVQLSPLSNYPFATGVSGLLGFLVDEPVKQ